jgi:hypothetical protein
VRCSGAPSRPARPRFETCRLSLAITDPRCRLLIRARTQADAATQASHCSYVTSNLETAKDFRDFYLALRIFAAPVIQFAPGGAHDELPGGITTITGQPLVHSLNSAPGVAAFAFSSEEVSTVGASCPTTSCAAVARMQPDPVSVSRPQRLATIPVLLGSLTFAGFWSLGLRISFCTRRTTLWASAVLLTFRVPSGRPLKSRWKWRALQWRPASGVREEIPHHSRVTRGGPSQRPASLS